MNTVASGDPRIEHVRVTEDEIIAQLVDGRAISVPLAWSWRLAEATPAQRANAPARDRAKKAPADYLLDAAAVRDLLEDLTEPLLIAALRQCMRK